MQKSSNKSKIQEIYACSICKKSYKTKFNLRYHQYTHNQGPGTFICTINDCMRTFQNPKRLSDHRRRYHLNTEDYVCEYCGYHTHIKCNLIVHRRKHTGEKPYYCEHCANSFTSSYQLNVHRETHKKSERKYCCVICAESFSDSKTLYHHESLHANTNKYVCKLCNKTYKQSAGLSQHVRWHRKQQDRYTDVIEIIK